MSSQDRASDRPVLEGEASPDVSSGIGTPSTVIRPPRPPLPQGNLQTHRQLDPNVIERESGDGMEGSESQSSVLVQSDVAQRSALQMGRPFRARWVPSVELLDQVMSCGFSKNAAEKALFYTVYEKSDAGNASADAAVLWIVEHPDADLESSLQDDETAPGGDMDNSDSEDDDEGYLVQPDQQYKMVYVVNGDLKMGVGKVAAQVAHATIGLYRQLLDTPSGHHQDALVHWDMAGETKVVVRGDNAQHLLQLNDVAREKGLPTFLVQDAGRTQIAAGSITVLAIFGTVGDVDQVTSSLRLLN